MQQQQMMQQQMMQQQMMQQQQQQQEHMQQEQMQQQQMQQQQMQQQQMQQQQMQQPHMQEQCSGKGGMAWGMQEQFSGKGGMAWGQQGMKRQMQPQMGMMQMQKRTRVEIPEGAAVLAEVRFDTPEAAQQALTMHGTEFNGAALTIEFDDRSKDGTKVFVRGFPAGTHYRALKDFFSQIGVVNYAGIRQDTTGMTVVGQVRFESPEEAQQALAMNGTMLNGYQIEVKLHGNSKDATKLQLLNLPPGMEWQELKTFFTSQGITPAYVDTTNRVPPTTAELRYDDPAHAHQALGMLQGSVISGQALTLALDESGEKLTIMVSGVPAGIEWQDLKDHFNQVGAVGYCEVHGPKAFGSKKGEGKGEFGKGDFGAGAMGCMKGQGKPLGNGLMVQPNGMIVKMS